MNSILSLIDKDSHLTPEAQYLSIALHLDVARSQSEYLDISISRLKTCFGSSPKTIAEVIFFFEKRGRGISQRDRARRKTFCFFPEYISSFMHDLSCNEQKIILELFSSEFRLKITELARSININLRNSNFLLMVIFVLHSNDAGFVEKLTNKKIRLLMGGITESRLKSQIDTLCQLSFIKAVGKGGAHSIYFGKFNKRYIIDLNLLSPELLNGTSKKGSSDRIKTIIDDVPEQFLTFQFDSNFNFEIDFYFDFAFKIVFWVGVINRSKNIEKIIDGFSISLLERVVFKRPGLSYLAIMERVEEVASFILEKHWEQVKQVKQIKDNNQFILARDAIWKSESFKTELYKKPIFTSKYLKESEKDNDVIKSTIEFFSQIIFSLSLSLSISLQKVLCHELNIQNNIKNINIILYDFHSYHETLYALPSCNTMVSFLFGSKICSLNVVAKKKELKEAIIRNEIRRTKNPYQAMDEIVKRDEIYELRKPKKTNYEYILT